MTNSAPHITEMNIALARALGVTDTTRINAITLRIESGKLPEVTVKRFVLPGDAGSLSDAIATVVSVYRLAPEEVV